MSEHTICVNCSRLCSVITIQDPLVTEAHGVKYTHYETAHLSDCCEYDVMSVQEWKESYGKIPANVQRELQAGGAL